MKIKFYDNSIVEVKHQPLYRTKHYVYLKKIDNSGYVGISNIVGEEMNITNNGMLAIIESSECWGKLCH